MAASSSTTSVERVEQKEELTKRQQEIRAQALEKYHKNVNDNITNFREFDQRPEVKKAKEQNTPELFFLVGNSPTPYHLSWLCDAIALDSRIASKASSHIKACLERKDESTKKEINDTLEKFIVNMMQINLEKDRNIAWLPDEVRTAVYYRLTPERNSRMARMANRLIRYSRNSYVGTFFTPMESGSSEEELKANNSIYGLPADNIPQSCFTAQEIYVRLAKKVQGEGKPILAAHYLFFASDACQRIDPKEIYLKKAIELAHSAIKLLIQSEDKSAHPIEAERLMCENLLIQVRKTHNQDLIIPCLIMLADAYHHADPRKKVIYVQEAYRLAAEDKREEKTERKELSQQLGNTIICYAAALDHAVSQEAKNADLYEAAKDIPDVSIQLFLAKKKVASDSPALFEEGIARFKQVMELIIKNNNIEKQVQTFMQIERTLAGLVSFEVADKRKRLVDELKVNLSTLKIKIDEQHLNQLIRLATQNKTKIFSPEEKLILSSHPSLKPCTILLAANAKDKYTERTLQHYARQFDLLAILLFARFLQTQNSKKRMAILYGLILLTPFAKEKIEHNNPWLDFKAMRGEALDYFSKKQKEDSFCRWLYLQHAAPDSAFRKLREEVRKKPADEKKSPISSMQILTYLLQKERSKGDACTPPFSKQQYRAMCDFFESGTAAAFGVSAIEVKEYTNTTPLITLLEPPTATVSSVEPSSSSSVTGSVIELPRTHLFASPAVGSAEKVPLSRSMLG